MDANGARALLARIEAGHWAQAPAVREGRQPAHDPDADRLLEVAEGRRYYAHGLEKLLVGDEWAPAALGRADVA